jgi:16S rRNA (cytosine967-C5)-methyltransferase
MTPAAHALGAIEVLSDMVARKRPASEALRDWGLSHRFAGSGDRARIASLVYDALRRRASSTFLLGSDEPRALVLGALVLMRGQDPGALAMAFAGAAHAPAPLTPQETAALADPSFASAPEWVRGDYPEWLDPLLAQTFGDDRAEEGAALATRAPFDLRANLLKTTREKVLAQLSDLGAEPTPLSPVGVRVPRAADGRGPPVQATPAFERGAFEVQDEGSQIAALLAVSVPGAQVVDLCAGAGGKTLALAASLGNHGQIYAYDSDARRMAPMVERLQRSGARNVQIRQPRRDRNVLADLDGKVDLVLVDAPCTGSGTWRRNPDAKWRLRPNALELRKGEQDAALARAARLVRPGGRIAYVTCSVLTEENGDRVGAFLEGNPEFSAILPAEMTAAAGPSLASLAAYATADGFGIQMTPRRTGTDGFFVSLLRRS